MAGSGVKISYSPKQLRVQAVFAAGAAKKGKAPPQGLVEKARLQMKKLQKAGTILLYETYEERLKETWEQLRGKNPGVRPDTVMHVDLAQGVPPLKGLQVEEAVFEEMAGDVAIKAPVATIKTWQVRWVMAFINEKMRSQGLQVCASEAAVRAMLVRALKGKAIRHYGVRNQSEEEARDPFKIRTFDSGREIIVRVDDVGAVAAPAGMQELLNIIKGNKKSLVQKGWKFMAFEKDLQGALKRAATGPEAVGVGLPLEILVGLALVKGKPLAVPKKPASPPRASAPAAAPARGAAPEAATASPAARQETPASGPAAAAVAKGPATDKAAETGTADQGAPAGEDKAGLKPRHDSIRLQVKVDAQKMQAYVEGFSTKWWKDHADMMTVDWVINEMAHMNIKVEDGQTIKRIQTLCDRKQDINGILVCQGKSGVGGQGPKLFPVYKEATGKAGGESDNIRQSQQRTIVQKDQLVGEIRYSEPGTPGSNVYGEPIPPPPGEPHNVEVKEGVKEKETGKFYALYDGLPEMTDTSIEVLRTLVFEGTVNLTSGDITFDGPVVIEGDVDTGATIQSTGKVTINGRVDGGSIIADGDIEVEGGVLTGPDAMLRSGGHIRADFTENSRLTAKKSITVQRGITNCQVVCGDKVIVESDEGSIAGGTLHVYNLVKTGNLGYPNANPTELILGAPWSTCRSLQIKERRLDRLRVAMEEAEKADKELGGRQPVKFKSRHEERAGNVKGRLDRIGAMVKTLKRQIKRLGKEMEYNEKVSVFVMGQLFSSCNIYMVGERIPVATEFKEVRVNAKKSKGTNISALTEEDLAELKAKPEEEKAPVKKAS